MKGLVNQAMPTSDTMPVPEQAPKEEVQGLREKASAEPVSAEQDDLTPEEREGYNSAMQMASEMLHKSDESFEAIMTQLQAAPIVDSIPEVISFVIEQIEYTFQGNLPEGIILPLVDEISDLVLELVDAAGFETIDEAKAEQVKTNSVQTIIDDYGASEEGLSEAMQGVSEQELMDIQKKFGGE